VAGTDLIGEYLGEIGRRLDATQRARLLEELRGHLEEAAERYRAGGLPEEDAVRQALDDCGSVRQMAAAVEVNDERKGRVMAATRWTGMAGLAAVPAAISGVMFWHPATFVLTLALAAAAVVGLLALHWGLGRWPITVGLVVLVAGGVVASANPHGAGPLLYSVGIPAACTLAAVTLACVVLLRGQVVPAPAVLLMLAGVGLLLGLNTALYVIGSEPPYLVTIGSAAALAGWLWTNGTLATGGARRRPVAAV
jgi:hypothetical protein